MTVKELITALQNEDPDAQVHIAYNYGDHWRTTVAPKARCVEECAVVYSEYHSMPKIVERDDEEDENPERPEMVVVISNMRLN